MHNVNFADEFRTKIFGSDTIVDDPHGIGVHVLKDGRFAIMNPLKVVPHLNALMLFVPHIGFENEGTCISLGSAGTHDWGFWTVFGSHKLYRIICRGCVRIGSHFCNVDLDSMHCDRLSDDIVQEELDNLFEGKTENPILSHIEVYKLHGNVYRLHCGKVHIFVHRKPGESTLIAGMHKSSKVVFTDDERVLKEVDRIALFENMKK